MRTARDGPRAPSLLNRDGDLRPRARRPRPRRARGRGRQARDRVAAGRREQPELAAAAAAAPGETTRPTASASAARHARRPRARASPPWRESSTSSTRGLTGRRRAARRHRRPWPTATGSSPTCTCTRRGRTTAQIEVDDLLDHAEAQGLGAIAVTDHNVFGGALEAVELARDRDLIVIPGEEVKTARPGRGDRALPRGGDPARACRSAETVAAIRAQGGVVYLPTRSTACTRSRSRRRCTGTSPRSTCSRSTTRACSSRPTTTRRCASRASTTSRWAPAPTRTSSRASAPVRCGCARFDGPDEFLASLRTAQVLRRPKLAALPAVAQVGGAGQGKSALGENEVQPCACRDDRRDLREVPAKGDLRDQRARRRDRPCRRRARVCPCSARAIRSQTSSCSSTSRSRRRCRKGSPSTAARGRRVAEVAPAPARRPDGGLRHELRSSSRPARTPRRRGRGWRASCTSSSRSSSS